MRLRGCRRPRNLVPAESARSRSGGQLWQPVVADTGNNVVHVVAETIATFYGIRMTTGHMYTVAGTPHRWLPWRRRARHDDRT